MTLKASNSQLNHHIQTHTTLNTHKHKTTTRTDITQPQPPTQEPQNTRKKEERLRTKEHI